MKETTSTSGQFICLEGPDGCGKTTQLQLLRTHLINQGHDVVIAREPGGTKWGMKIREIFLDGQGELDPMTEVLLLLAAKAQVLREVIYPAYNSGKYVLMDRYTDSLLAYQGGGRQLGRRKLIDTVRAAELNFTPTFTIFIDTPLQLCQDRIYTRSSLVNNSIDRLDESYHRRVHRAYQEIISEGRQCGRPLVVVDGSVTVDEVHQSIIESLGTSISNIEMRD
jgi:dTMP kinase